MQRVTLNRATMRVAETTKVSGRVTAESIKYGVWAKKQSAPPRKRLFARFLLAAGAMLLSVTSYGQAINSVPYTITQPGAYFLNKDLVYSPLTGTAISINSSNVILDFGGHVLTGSRTFFSPSQATGVALATNNQPIENVTIRNGTISGFQRGIFLAGVNEGASSTGHVVEEMHITAITSTTTVTAGIDLGGAQGCLISNDFVNNVSNGIGSAFTGIGQCQFIHNRVINCNIGFLCASANNSNYLESNFASNCGTGFICASDKLRLHNNSLYDAILRRNTNYRR